MRGTIRPVEEERIADRLTVAIRVDAGQGREDVGPGVRNHRRVVIVQDGPVADQEVVEIGHLLDVRGDIRVVTAEVDVVELQLDNVLDRASS